MSSFIMAWFCPIQGSIRNSNLQIVMTDMRQEYLTLKLEVGNEKSTTFFTRGKKYFDKTL